MKQLSVGNFHVMKGAVKEKTPYEKNPFLEIGSPKLGPNQRWKVIGYFHGISFKKIDLSFDHFKGVQFITQSNGYFHFYADGKFTIVCIIEVI